MPISAACLVELLVIKHTERIGFSFRYQFKEISSWLTP
jgi:hypothetical protein